MTEQRSQPPRLQGYTYKRWLGGGGFADVFLYDQLRPAREVAIKVLRLGELDAEARRAFDTEANLMARVSAHPFIVTVLGADSAQDGRPYLVMEYYAQPHYGERAARGNIGVADVLRLGVQVGSAVEVAHQAGILHRDIKPANILVNEYGRPGLTDFGIAGARADGDEEAASGWSVPYAPPEILSGASPGDEVSDVYSLAATLYTILAGRSPFASTAGRSSGPELQARVLNLAVPPIRRPDVPEAFELLLAQALAKDPAARPRSALSFARSLQGIQRDMRFEPTELEVPEAPTPRPVRPLQDAEGTRAGRLQVVRPDGPTGPVRESTGLVTSASVIAVPVFDRPATFQGPLPALASAPETVHRRDPPREAPTPPPEIGLDRSWERRVPRPLAIGAAVLVAAVAIAALFVGLTSHDPGGKKGNTPTTDDGDVTVASGQPAAPSGVTVRVSSGGLDVSWTADGHQQNDKYLINRADSPTAAAPLTTVDASPAHVAGAKGDCLQVVAVRGSFISEPGTGCAQQ